MPKKTIGFNYLLAYNLLKGLDRVSVIESSSFLNNKNGDKNDDYDGIILQSEIVDPEKMYLKKEAYNNLSEEAKEVISVIINAPQEFLDLFKTNERLIISRTIFQRVFEESWKSKWIVEQTFNEIKKWVMTL